MQEDTIHTRRQWQRQLSKLPIGLILEDVLFRTHDSAITVDICPRGASVQTKLALAPGEWLTVATTSEFTQATGAMVVWVRFDHINHLTSAGLEFC